jgi:hypothetical protein
VWGVAVRERGREEGGRSPAEDEDEEAAAAVVVWPAMRFPFLCPSPSSLLSPPDWTTVSSTCPGQAQAQAARAVCTGPSSPRLGAISARPRAP